MNIKQMQSSKKGFTLIELMIVIAIIGILAGVAIPNFISYRDKSFCTTTEADYDGIANALVAYFSIPGHTTLETLHMPLLLADNPNNLDNRSSGFSGGAPQGTGSNISSPVFTPLSGNNIATIGGGVSGIRITIVESVHRCPEDYMNGMSGGTKRWISDGGDLIYFGELQ